MRPPKTLRPILIVVVAASATWLFAQKTPGLGGKVQLRLNLQQGKTYTTRVTTSQEISQEILGQKQDMTQEMGLGYAFEVQQVASDGTMSAKMTCNWTSFKQDSPLGKVDYDSSKATQAIPTAAKPFAALVGTSLTMDLSPQGEVSNVKGLEKMIEAVLKSLELPAGTPKADLENQLREQFGDKAMQENMSQMMAVFPPKPVGIGDSWSKQLSLAKPFPMRVDTTWTLKARKNGIAVVDIRSKLETDPKGEAMKLGPMSLRPSLSGTQTGTQQIDEATGWVKSGKIQQEFSGKLKIEGAPGKPEGLEWPISVKSTVLVQSQ